MEIKTLPTVEVYPDVESLSLVAAELLSRVGDRAIAERNRLLVALSGSSTPKCMFQILANLPFTQSLARQSMHIF